MKKQFEAMQEMVDNNMDISMSTTMLSIDKHPLGAILKVGVDTSSINKLASNDYIFCLLVINKKQFKEVQEREENND